MESVRFSTVHKESPNVTKKLNKIQIKFQSKKYDSTRKLLIKITENGNRTFCFEKERKMMRRFRTKNTENLEKLLVAT